MVLRKVTEREVSPGGVLLRRTRARSAHRGDRRGRRGGLTLVELLVVVIILTTLVAAAVPLMAPNNETRRLREATRSLQTVITTAQTKATELGRPYGIWLERQSAVVHSEVAATGTAPPEPDPRDMGAVLTVYYCEQPQPFAGFSTDSKAIVTPVNPGGILDRGEHVYVVFGRRDPGSGQFVREPLPSLMFRPYDRIVIGHATYLFLAPEQSRNTWATDAKVFLSGKDAYELAFEGSSSVALNLQYVPQPPLPISLGSQPWTFPKSFEILRQPQKVGDPYQLPAGTAIDLEASGDRTFFYHDPRRTGDPLQFGGGRNYNLAPVVVLFSPGGSVHSVLRNDGDLEQPDSLQKIAHGPSDGTIYLMVTSRERTGETGLDSSGTPVGDLTRTSWLDPESLWVSVAPQTGRVVTEENAVVDGLSTMTWTYDDLTMQRRAAREFARQSLGLGGR